MRSLSHDQQEAFYQAGLAASGLGQDPRRRRRTWTVRPGFGEQTRPGNVAFGNQPGNTPRGGAGSSSPGTGPSAGPGAGTGPGGPFVPAGTPGAFIPGAANPFAPAGGNGYPFGSDTPTGATIPFQPGTTESGGDPGPTPGPQGAPGQQFGQTRFGSDILPRLEMPPITPDSTSVDDAGSGSGSSTYTLSEIPPPGGGVKGLRGNDGPTLANTLAHAAISGIAAAVAIAAMPAIVRAVKRIAPVLAIALVCLTAASPAPAQIWVSASRGSDANPGTEARPIRTFIEADKRTRTRPQPVRLFEAETYGPIVGEYGDWKNPGIRFEAWPLDGNRRPTIAAGSAAGIVLLGDFAAPVELIGLDFTGRGPAGIIQRGNGAGVRIADCMIRGFGNGIILEGLDKTPGDRRGRITAAEVYRTGIFDPSSATSHSQGIYASAVDGLRMYQTVIDNAGRDANGNGTIFNHNAYIQPGNTGIDFEANIITNASATGLQLRGGNIRAIGNFLARNAIGIGAGHAQSDIAFTGVILDNVIIEPRDISPTLPRGWAMTTHKLDSAIIAGNFAYGGTPTSRRGLYREPGTWSKSAEFEANVFAGFDAPRAFETPAAEDETFTANRFTRSLPIVTPRIDVGALLTYHRSRPRNTWDDTYSAEAITRAVRRLMIDDKPNASQEPATP